MRIDIFTLTKDCKSDACRVSYGGSATTLMGFTQEYDKKGNPLHRDPNITTSNFGCSTCGRQWKVKSRDGEPDQIETVLEPSDAA